MLTSPPTARLFARPDVLLDTLTQLGLLIIEFEPTPEQLAGFGVTAGLLEQLRVVQERMTADADRAGLGWRVRTP